MERRTLRRWARRRTLAGERSLVLVIKHITPVARKAYDAGFWMRPEVAAQLLKESKAQYKQDKASAKPGERPVPKFRVATLEDHPKVDEERRKYKLPIMPEGRTWKEVPCEKKDYSVNRPQMFIQTKEPDGDTTYKPNPDTGEGRMRQREWDNAIQGLLSKVKPPEPPARPVAVFMMGGTATGKSSAVKTHFGTKEEIAQKFAWCDPDAMKEKLSEYREGIDEDRKRGWSDTNAALRVHEESSQMAKNAVNQAIGEGKSFIWDGTGKTTHTYHDFLDAVDQYNAAARVAVPPKQTYDTQLICCDVPDVAVMKLRANERAEALGRYVPPPVIEEGHTFIPGNFVGLSARVNHATLIDTTERTPVTAYAKHPGEENFVKNKEIWDALTKRALPERTGGSKGKAKAHALRKWATRKLADNTRTSADEGPLDVDLVAFVDGIMQGLKDYRDELEKMPKQFKSGEGIVSPEED